MNLTKNNFKLYEGCGNKVLITTLGSFDKNDTNLRKQLTKVGLKHNADSVMVLTGNPNRFQSQGYHVTMDVFEPRGNDAKNPQLAGSWSTMCGNGIRAVTRYLIDQGEINTQGKCFIKTRSGVLPIEILPDNQFRVCLGQFITNPQSLSRYIASFNFKTLIPPDLSLWKMFAGLNGNKNGQGYIDGEPHIILLLRQSRLNTNDLSSLAEKFGPQITTNSKYFPYDINSNFVSIENQVSDRLIVNACTFERGIEYVTRACGTGATVIGSWFLQRHPSLCEVLVKMPGGDLTVTHNNNKFYLQGPANPVEK